MTGNWVKVEEEGKEGGNFSQFELTVGNEVEGVFKGEKEIPKKEGGKFSVFIVDKDDGTQVSFIKHTVLVGKLKGVPVGRRVKITYIGVPAGKSYNNYQVDLWEDGTDAHEATPEEEF